MQLALTYVIEILVFVFALLMVFDFVAGLLMWQKSAPLTKTSSSPVIYNNIYNFGRILATSDVG
jgi:hypothetical protein